MKNKEFISRKPTRLAPYDYSTTGGYYVTICAYQMQHLFSHVIKGKAYLNDVGRIMRRHWMRIPSKVPSVTLDDFVIMPNHLHGVLILEETEEEKRTTLQVIINHYKGAVTKACRQTGLLAATDEVWQGSFYDHIIRDVSDLERIRRYLADNPGRWEEDLRREGPAGLPFLKKP